MLDALVVAPHPDDAELGMGGTIALMRAQGMKVGILDLTDGEPTWDSTGGTTSVCPIAAFAPRSPPAGRWPG
jgi:LmbE family N-acetylglucosaminyl deacetylase